jgi:hypothetical protein
MKIAAILSLAVLFVWYTITRLEPSSGHVVLDEDTMSQMNRNAFIQKALWFIMIILQTVLAYRLYKLIPDLAGVYKTGAKLYLGVIVLLLLLSLLIFIMGLRAFWF